MKLPWKKKQLESVNSSRAGWFSWTINEPFTGAWQKNIKWTRESVLSHPAIFSCITLISGDVSKMRLQTVAIDSDGIKTPVVIDKFKFLSKPNNYQNRIQFFESWMNSKLIRGNTYVLKGRDRNGDVNSLYILHPDLVTPMVSESGDVFYQLGGDNLNNINQSGVTVPASEIIHDRFNCFFHPLVGLSPIFACGLVAFGGIKMLENSAKLFANGARPTGILTAPGAITNETAERLKLHWEKNYGGENYGKTAVLGDDLKYTPLTVTAVESQMIEQMKMGAEMICACFHVPPYKVMGNAPTHNNAEILQQQYYDQCLQNHIESIEECLDQDLDLPMNVRIQFNLDGLLRMDTKTQVETLGAGVNKAIYAPNEARKKMNMKPVEGGDVPFLQQQNWPINMLAGRSIEELNGTQPDAPGPVPVDDTEKQFMGIALMLKKELKGAKYDA